MKRLLFVGIIAINSLSFGMEKTAAEDVKSAAEPAAHRASIKIVNQQHALELKKPIIKATSAVTALLAREIIEDRIEYYDFIILFSCKYPHIIIDNDASQLHEINKKELIDQLTVLKLENGEFATAFHEGDGNGLTPLMAACALSEENTTLVDFILDRPSQRATVNTYNANKNSALSFATLNNHEKICAMLLSHQAQYKNKDQMERMPVPLAIRLERINILGQFIKAGFDGNFIELADADVKEKSENNLTRKTHIDPLIVAFSCFKPEALKTLLTTRTPLTVERLKDIFLHVKKMSERNAHTFKENIDLVALCLKIILDHIARIEPSTKMPILDFQLIEQLDKLSLLVSIKSNNITPLMLASGLTNRMLSCALVKILLADPGHKRTIDAITDTQATALMFASRAGNDQSASVLIAHKASLLKKDNIGYDALNHAVVFFVWHRNIEIIRILHSAGAPIDTLNFLGRTPLINAVIFSPFVELVNELLGRSASFAAIDKLQNAALFYTFDRTKVVTVQKLSELCPDKSVNFEKNLAQIKAILLKRIQEELKTNTASQSTSKKGKKKKSKK